MSPLDDLPCSAFFHPTRIPNRIQPITGPHQRTLFPVRSRDGVLAGRNGKTRRHPNGADAQSGRSVLPASALNRNLPRCRIWLAALAMLVSLSVIPVQAWSTPPPYNDSAGHHDLRVELDLSTGTLHGRSVIRHAPLTSATLDYFLHPRMQLHAVELDGQPVAYRSDAGRLRIAPDMAKVGKDVLLSITYSGIFHDPVPLSRFSTDNTGFGVSATITEQGVFFQGQSGWFPRSTDQNPSVTLEVTAPEGVLAVTAGRLLGHAHQGGQSISRWQVDQLGRGMPLSAGRYIQRQLQTDSVAIYTYFLSDNDHLAPKYLEASARHLATYEQLHGPYAFDHFAVVENFFPSGFGMPSYTLLGSAILRLPFIPETSLRHEVAHCWWGNGVFVDYSQGNWSEGLTTYVSDYLIQEEESPESAREYRMRILRDYALLAAGRKDFPVARFLSRTDPASRVVGYGKAMYIVHMIRQQMGDDAFWGALRLFYDQWLFHAATWQDMFQSFAQAGWNSAPIQEGNGRNTPATEAFVSQWLMSSGAPDLRLQDVQLTEHAQGWRVDAVLAQNAPYYDLSVPIHLETTSGTSEHSLELQSETARIAIDSPNKPRRLLVDPEHHLFRLLSPVEIPPTVNSIRGAPRLLVVRSTDMEHVPEEIIRGFLRSMNQPRARIVLEPEALAEARQASHLLFFGMPRAAALRALVVMPEVYQLHPATRHIARSQLLPGIGNSDPGPKTTHGIPRKTDPKTDMKIHSDQPHPEVDTLFLLLPHPDHDQGVIGLFSATPDLDAEAVADTVRRITHYGKDSYLGFQRGQNRLRGAWPALASPLIKDFQP